MNILIFICLSIGYLFIKIKENIHILQQNFYNENGRYIKWGIKNTFVVFNIFDIVITMVNLYNLKYHNTYLVWINMGYLLLFIYYIKKKKEVKIPLKITGRIKRLFIILGILYGLPLITLKNKIYLYYFVYSLLISFSYLIVFLGNVISIPIEKIIFYHYKKKTLRKLKVCKDMVTIGITGSYGKTSCKNILYEILNIKYKVVATPKNYNTMYGLMITINDCLNKFTDIFIAEMGAYKLGSIKRLCELVKPRYGIITTIGIAHLETFRSRENIQKGKFELIDALPSDGIAILNRDDKYQVNYKINNNVQVIWIGINNKYADVWAKDITITSNGCNFDIVFKDDKNSYLFETKLLGYHNIYNILSGVALGKYLGLSIKELQLGVKRVKAISHRLEMKRLGDMVIIDGSYNSNPVGANEALNVLNLMEGTKIVVTPGMIELGTLEDEYNKKFGKLMSNVADYVILVGKKKTKVIYEGLRESLYSKDKIFIINSLQEAFRIINNISGKKNILLENDLPDIFSEN